MNLREGGTSLVCMRAKQFGGYAMYNTWTYKKIVPLQRIEFILNFADKDGNKLNPANIGLPPGIRGCAPCRNLSKGTRSAASYYSTERSTH